MRTFLIYIFLFNTLFEAIGTWKIVTFYQEIKYVSRRVYNFYNTYVLPLSCHFYTLKFNKCTISMIYIYGLIIIPLPKLKGTLN